MRRNPHRRPWATFLGYHGECAKCGLETGNPKRDLDRDGLCKFCRPETEAETVLARAQSV